MCVLYLAQLYFFHFSFSQNLFFNGIYADPLPNLLNIKLRRAPQLYIRNFPLGHPLIQRPHRGPNVFRKLFYVKKFSVRTYEIPHIIYPPKIPRLYSWIYFLAYDAVHRHVLSGYALLLQSLRVYRSRRTCILKLLLVSYPS